MNLQILFVETIYKKRREKNSMKKKLFAVLMAMVLVLGMSTTALAENNNSPRIDTSNWDSPYWDNSPEVGDIVWNGIAYDYADDKSFCEVVGLGKEIENDREYIYIPASIDGVPVTSIGNAFKDNATIKYVSIPATVKMIGENAFYNCANLATILYAGMEYTDVAEFVKAYSANGGAFGSPSPASNEFAGTKLTGADEASDPVEVREIKVTWSETTPWTVVAENVTPEDECWDYYFEFYLDGEWVDWDYTWAYSGDEVSMDMSWYVSMYGEGKYTVVVKSGNMESLDDEDGVRAKGTSAARTYVEPENKIPTPANFAFDKESGKVTFDTVEGAISYEIYVYIYVADKLEAQYCCERVDKEDISGTKAEIEVPDVVADIEYYEETDELKDIDFRYEVGVIAVSDNIDKAADSEPATIVLFENKLTKEQVKENFDKAFENVEEEPTEAVSALSAVSNETIIEMLETDSEFAEKFEKLDEILIEAYGDAYKGATSETDVVDASKVKVLGLAINGYAGVTSIELSFADVEDDAKVDVPEGYKEAVQLDIKLMLEDFSRTNLSAPVTITMPIPAGVEKENLVILHYHGDATTPAVIVPTVNDDGTMTFVVDGFSTFVVANEVVEETPAPTPTPEKPTPETPKTGDTSGTALVCSLLFLAAGVVLVLKRNSFAK